LGYNGFVSYTTPCGQWWEEFDKSSFHPSIFIFNVSFHDINFYNTVHYIFNYWQGVNNALESRRLLNPYQWIYERVLCLMHISFSGWWWDKFDKTSFYHQISTCILMIFLFTNSWCFKRTWV
jgi:hypothetical protein